MMDSSSHLDAPAPYRNAQLPVDERVEDLLGRMTVAEKAGLLFHTIISMGPRGQLTEERDAVFDIPSTDELLQGRNMNHFNLLGPVRDARETAAWHNRLQRRALETTRLGIPVTLSTDPRSHFSENLGTGFSAGALSLWPETLGLAALRSASLVERFADVARQEYLALGLRVALHPQVDLATEPRWSRIGRTFGEDAALTAELAAAYVRGFQAGRVLGPQSVATMTKHFPGGGPQKDGEDPHFDYGREQVYPGHNFEYHLVPFKAAIDAGTTQIMPYYGMPVDTEYEPVGFAFNKGIITDLLREQMGFQGIVCTDWGLVTDAIVAGQPLPARAWGVEHLSERERVKKILDAGCDQLGGEARPELVIELVEAGLVPESRIDESVRRLLREKFLLGLFEQPFVDEDAAAATVGRADFVAEGQAVQRRALTLLTNKNGLLPLRRDRCQYQKIYIEGIDTALLVARGFTVVDSPAAADVALLRLRTPHEAFRGGFASRFHRGSLAFPSAEQERQRAVYATVPTIVDIYLDRPAVVPEVAAFAAAMLANFGCSADTLLDVVLGVAAPEGRLPFDLPASMEAVASSKSDVAFDTVDPVFRFGHGLRYENGVGANKDAE